MANRSRIKRRLLKEAVEENLDTIRGGVVPRGLRADRRLLRLWARRSLLLLLPASLLGSTYIVTTAQHQSEEPLQLASVAPVTALQRRASAVNLTNSFSAPTTAIDPAILSLDVRRIVIDAGHGGTSPGTRTITGVFEKELTIDIARRLRDLLERDRFDVVMTRENDESLTLQQRASLANRSHGDVFISIHLNWLKNPENRGIETYYLGPTNDPLLTAMAAEENRDSGYSLSDMRRLLDGIYADVRQDESKRLAEAVQSKLYENLRKTNPRIADRGVKTAPFVVLVATEMPAILAEVSCLSNQQEAELLAKPEYRQRIAEALFSGIQTYVTRRDATQKGS